MGPNASLWVLIPHIEIVPPPPPPSWLPAWFAGNGDSPSQLRLSFLRLDECVFGEFAGEATAAFLIQGGPGPSRSRASFTHSHLSPSHLPLVLIPTSPAALRERGTHPSGSPCVFRAGAAAWDRAGAREPP